MGSNGPKTSEDEVVRYLKAIMLLQLRQFSEESESVKPEVLLLKAGFTHREIADFLGKSPDAVSKTISRAK